MKSIGLDIGGANLKAADGAGFCRHVEFPLWKDKNELPSQIARLLSSCPEHHLLAISMTGELADCFNDKREGVEFIVDSACRASTRPVVVYTIGQGFVTPREAKLTAEQAAAANWHALACFASRLAQTSEAIVVDVGSTTTDVIPVCQGNVSAMGCNDYERLVSGELLYTGIERSPICGLARSLRHRGQSCPLMNEWFATTLDAYVILGTIASSNSTRGTADGRARTVEASVARLARMIGKDSSTFDFDDAIELSQQIKGLQVNFVSDAIERVAARFSPSPWTLITAGQGEFLVDGPPIDFNPACLFDQPEWNQNIRRVSLTSLLGPQVSACATAYALATLVSEANDAGRLSNLDVSSTSAGGS